MNKKVFFNKLKLIKNDQKIEIIFALHRNNQKI